MPLISPVIGMFCSSTFSSQPDACNKATEAFSKQTGISQTVDKTESYTINTSQKASDSYLGEDVTKGAVGSVYVYRVYKTKTVKLKVPTLGVCDSITTQLSPTTYSLNFNWKIW